MTLDRIPGAKRVLSKIGVLDTGQSRTWDREIRRVNICKRLPYPDDSVDVVYSSHVLEHLYLSDVKHVLRETWRVLKSGGLVRVNVPDALRNAEALIAGEAGTRGDPGENFNYHLLAHPESRPTLFGAAKRAIGGHVHLWQPTESQLRLLLNTAGFVGVERHDFRTGSMPDLDIIETRPDSLYLEARKS